MTTGKDTRLWRDFSGWCDGRRLRPLPAHPWTVAAYLRWRATRRRKDPHEAALEAIARMLLLRGVPAPNRHPTVTRTLEVVETLQRERGQRAALFDPAVASEKAATKAKAKAKKKSTARKGATKPRRSMRAGPRLVSPPSARRTKKAGGAKTSKKASKK